jgi:ATP-dependent Clp protease ATP-binding subunit ClpA
MLHPARISLATGETISLIHWHVVFTSNIGAAEAMRMESSNFASIGSAILRRLSQELRPELEARIADKIVFARLPHDVQREICSLLVAGEVARLRGLGPDLTVSREAVEFLLREGFDAHRGARPLRRVVERFLQQAVVQRLLSQGTAVGEIVPYEDGLFLK